MKKIFLNRIKFLTLILISTTLLSTFFILNNTIKNNVDNKELKNNIDINNISQQQETNFYVADDSETVFYYTETGEIWAWGRNSEGQLGLTGDFDNYHSPTRVDDDWNQHFDTSQIKNIFSLHNLTYVILNDDSIYGWGSNLFGELGTGISVAIQSIIRLDTIWNNYFDVYAVKKYIFDKRTMFAFLDDGSIYSWGFNGYMNIGIGPSPAFFLEPTRVDLDWDTTMESSRITDLYFAEQATYAFLDDGKIYAWGVNSSGEFGFSGAPDFLFVPTRVDHYWSSIFDISLIETFYVSHYAVYVLLNNGEIWGWGRNSEGQLGISNLQNADIPIRLDTIWNFSSEIIKFNFTLHSVFVTLEDGTVWGWGDNYEGVLGVGHSDNVKTPTRLDTFWINYGLDISKLEFFICIRNSVFAMLDDGSIYVWGDNKWGQLGLNSDGFFENTTTPLLALQFTNLSSQWINNSLEISFNYYDDNSFNLDGNGWGTGELFLTIYILNMDNSKNTIISSTEITSLNTDGTTTTFTTDPLIYFDEYYIEITSKENSEGILFIDEVATLPDESFIKNVKVLNTNTNSIDIEYKYYAGLLGDGQIQYSIDQGINWIEIPDIATDQSVNTFKIPNLNSNTSYEIIVVPTLEPGNLSYSSIVTAKTEIPSIISNVFINNITENSAEVNYYYEPGTISTGNIKYSIDNGNSWIIKAVLNNNATNTFTIDNLNPGIEYEVIVVPEDEDVTNLISVSFTTLDTESIISDVEAVNITDSTAKINYEFTPGTASSRDVLYSIDHGLTWTKVTPTPISTFKNLNTFTLENLDESTTYQIVIIPEPVEGERNLNGESTVFTTTEFVDPSQNESTWWTNNAWWTTLTLAIIGVIAIGLPTSLIILNKK